MSQCFNLMNQCEKQLLSFSGAFESSAGLVQINSGGADRGNIAEFCQSFFLDLVRKMRVDPCLLKILFHTGSQSFQAVRLSFAVSEEHTENRPRLDNDSWGFDHTVDVDTAVQDHRCRAGTFQNPAGAEDIEDWDHKRIFRSNPLKKRNRFLQGIKFHADKGR